MFVMLIPLFVGACAPLKPSSPADRFAGTWTGTMNMISDPTASAISIVTIPTGCSDNKPCGDATNTSNGCKWEMTLESVKGDVFEYSYSKSLERDCPAFGSGMLTMNSDGTLFREHKFPDFTITGILRRR